MDKLQTKAEFNLMDIRGRIIQRQQLNVESAEIKIAGIKEGIYFVYISDNEVVLYRKKIFITERFSD
ncbi:hypothetical protein BH11BAC7_BH11BAC7_00810 [soil metagenome]